MKNETQTVQTLIRVIHMALRDLTEENISDPGDFCRGQIYAYVECLEILQLCPSFREFGLDYDIEKKYPLH